MRISDWSSDVCSSDLAEDPGRAHDLADFRQGGLKILARYAVRQVLGHRFLLAVALLPRVLRCSWDAADQSASTGARSEGRRVGKERFRTCRYRWSPYH